MRRLLAVAMVTTLLVGCGGGGGPTTASTETTATTEPASSTAPSGGDDLPGERAEIYPYEGAKLAVAGVAAGDTLRVRSGPGVGFDVVFELDPLGTATATGHNRSLREGGFWSQIRADGRTGWANTAYLLQPGTVDDVTAALFPTPADRPAAETLERLAEVVAGRRASTEPPSRVVIVDGPSTGDLGEVTVDVIGLGDDAQGGERLKVFAEPDRPAGRFTVRTVEATALCSRGVTADGLCV